MKMIVKITEIFFSTILIIIITFQAGKKRKIKSKHVQINNPESGSRSGSGVGMGEIPGYSGEEGNSNIPMYINPMHSREKKLDPSVGLGSSNEFDNEEDFNSSAQIRTR